MGTGHHAAVAAKVGPRKSVAVVGDGAVGLCGVLAAKGLGAEQIIILGRHPDRIALAREFGATDVVSERGDEAVERVRALTDGHGVHSVLECIGLEQSELTAIQIARPRRRVGAPQDETIPAPQPAFYNNVSVSGGSAPARAYIEELLPDVLEGKIQPGRVFDRVIGLDDVPGRLPGDERLRSNQGHGDALMSTWTNAELEKIASADELEIAAAPTARCQNPPRSGSSASVTTSTCAPGEGPREAGYEP